MVVHGAAVNNPVRFSVPVAAPAANRITAVVTIMQPASAGSRRGNAMTARQTGIETMSGARAATRREGPIGHDLAGPASCGPWLAPSGPWPAAGDWRQGLVITALFMVAASALLFLVV